MPALSPEHSSGGKGDPFEDEPPISKYLLTEIRGFEETLQRRYGQDYSMSQAVRSADLVAPYMGLLVSYLAVGPLEVAIHSLVNVLGSIHRDPGQKDQPNS